MTGPSTALLRCCRASGTRRAPPWPLKPRIIDQRLSIDATSTHEAPEITSVDPGTSQVAMTWTDTPSPQAFLVAVIPVPFTGFYAAARVVSGDTRTLTFSGLSLVPGSSYQAVVCAYDKDVMTPGAIGSQFKYRCARRHSHNTYPVVGPAPAQASPITA